MHYCSSEEVSENETNASNELQFIAEGVAANPVILEKSQVPKIKRRKDEAIGALTNKYAATFGRPVDAKGLLKKINNMKTRLKKKTDLKKTGNKAIKLLDWEKRLLKAMEGDSNPTIGRIGGAIQVGIHEDESIQQRGSEPADERRSSKVSREEACGGVSEPPQNLLPPKKKLATDKYETDETRALTTKELQRLVLLQQYRTSIVQNEYYEKKLEMIKKATPTTVSDGEHTYFKL